MRGISDVTDVQMREKAICSIGVVSKNRWFLGWREKERPDLFKLSSEAFTGVPKSH